MAGWASNNQKLSEHDVVWRPQFSQKLGMELMQNCDLPPPQKIFSGSDERVISSMNRVCGMMTGREEDGEYEKLELLKALRLSQTRAREAERRAESLAKERDFIANVLMKQSLELFACRQWVKLLEVQVLMLQPHRQGSEKEMGGSWGSKEEDDDGGGGGEVVSWIVALAICVGIAGVGLAFGCRHWL